MHIRAFLFACFLTILSAQRFANADQIAVAREWNADVDVRALHATLNTTRASFHLTRLRLDPRLCAIAKAYARDMVARGFFGHVSPEGRTLTDRFKSGHVRASWAAENIALDRDVRSVARSLFASPPHRANMLDVRYANVGIGVARNGRDEIVVEDFSN